LAYGCRRTLKQEGRAIEEFTGTRIITAEGRLGRVRYIAYGLGLFLVAGILLSVVLNVAILLGMQAGTSEIIVGVAGVAIGIGCLVLYVLWTIRRLHDFNVNGWFTFIFILPLINLVLWLIPGTRRENNYGSMQPPNTLGVILSLSVTILAFIVLAAITITARQDHTIRSQISEGLNLSSTAKAAVTDHFQATGEWAANNESAGLLPANRLAGIYVSSVAVDAGNIVITYGDQAHVLINGKTLVITPETQSNDLLTWSCSSQSIEPKHLPADCR